MRRLAARRQAMEPARCMQAPEQSIQDLAGAQIAGVAGGVTLAAAAPQPIPIPYPNVRSLAHPVGPA